MPAKKRATKKATAAKKRTLRVTRQRFKLSDLAPAKYNPRLISDAAFAGLAKSLEHFGLVEHVVVNARGNRVISGHQRVRALQEAGAAEVDAIVVRFDDEKERLANFAMNNPHIRGELIGYQVKEIVAEIRKNIGEDAEAMLKGLRFDVMLRNLSREQRLKPAAVESRRVTTGKVADEAMPSIVKSRVESKSGRCYRLGNHVLFCGKLHAPGTLHDVGLDTAADLCVTRFSQSTTYRDDYLDVYLKHALENTEGAVYVVSDFNQLPGVQDRFIALGGHWSTTIIGWTKALKPSASEMFRDVTVPVLYGWRDEGPHTFYGGRDKANVMQLPEPPPKNDMPVEMAVQFMLNSSTVDATVLDVHVGSGATLIAAEKTGRRLHGYVRSPRDLDRVRARWTSFVHGEKADWRKKTSEVAFG